MNIQKDRLIKPKTAVMTGFEDMVYLAMLNIEEGLLIAGAVPDVDYSYRDLLQAAMPIVQHQWATGKLDLWVGDGRDCMAG